MTQLFVNNFRTRLAVPLAADATVMYLESTAGLPQMRPEDNNTLSVTIFRNDGFSESGWEVVTITSHVDNACTVIRSTEGAAPSLFTVERTLVEARITAGSLNKFMASWSLFAPRTLVSDLANGIDELKGSGQIAHAGQNLRTYLLGMSSLVESIRAAQGTGVVGKNTLADLNADLEHAANTVAYVLLDPTSANNTTYLKQGDAGVGAWIPSSTSPVSMLSARVDQLPIVETPQNDALFELLSSDRFMVGQIGTDRFDIPNLSVITTASNTMEIVDSMGFILMDSGPMETPDIYLRSTAFDSLEMVAQDNFIVHDFMHPLEVSAAELADEVPLPSTIPYISQLLCGVQGVPVSLYVRNMLESRSDTDLVRATLAAVAAPRVVTSNDELRVLTAELGGSANLYLRAERGNAGVRTRLPLTVATAPNPHPGPAPKPKILIIGDSIGNRQAAYLMNENLTAWGYAPSFIGTIKGLGATTYDGPLGESREGWETGDFTNAIVDRSFPIQPGAEAPYMAMDRNTQRDHNPFIRAATEADDPAIVRNGYVLDFQYYCSRFGLDTPDIVIYALGTNDVRDRDAAVIRDVVYENDLLFMKRLRAAWPDVKIIRSLPAVPRDVARDRLWTAEYIPVIRAMLDAKNTLLDPKLYVAPVWAMTTQEAGWTMKAGIVDATTGALTAGWDDNIHLIGPARYQMYQALSGYVACAASNLI